MRMTPRFILAHSDSLKFVPYGTDSKVHGANIGPACWPHMGPMLAPWTLLLGDSRPYLRRVSYRSCLPRSYQSEMLLSFIFVFHLWYLKRRNCNRISWQKPIRHIDNEINAEEHMCNLIVASYKNICRHMDDPYTCMTDNWKVNIFKVYRPCRFCDTGENNNIIKIPASYIYKVTPSHCLNQQWSLLSLIHWKPFHEI